MGLLQEGIRPYVIGVGKGIFDVPEDVEGLARRNVKGPLLPETKAKGIVANLGKVPYEI